ncbi:hypothetical protein HDV01_007150 [Terramyces sp. JEL0728]|nr:hypothetical protein HDV01_007150 [Terramyces sp. JEL0728]
MSLELTMLSLLLISIAIASAPVYISFRADYTNVILDGALTTTSNAQIIYDFYRPVCLHSPHFNQQNWAAFVYYVYNNNFNHVYNELIAYHVDNRTESYAVPLVNMEKGDLAVWFACGMGSDIAYDSDFGRNFHFQIL